MGLVVTCCCTYEGIVGGVVGARAAWAVEGRGGGVTEGITEYPNLIDLVKFRFLKVWTIFSASR